MSSRSFADQIALVTGGASGIGAALGAELARSGAVVVLADRQRELAERVASELRARGGRAEAAEIDVRELASIERVVAATLARHGRIDLCFNNAGIAVGGEVDSYVQRDWDDVIDVNLRGVAYGIQAVYPVMIRQGSGHIVNTASLAGLVSAPAEGSYGATKHAVVGLSKTLRIEARRHGVRVSVLCPGVVRTPILTGGAFGRLNLHGVTDEAISAMWARARPMSPEQFARRALRAVANNEGIIVVPQFWKVLWYLERLSPELSGSLWGWFLARVRKDLEQAGGTLGPRA